MKADQPGGASERRIARPVLNLGVVEVVVVLSFVAAVTLLLLRNPRGLGVSLLFWVAIVAVVELLPVPILRGVQVSIAFPVLMAAGFLHPPAIAALIAFVGSLDPREFRFEVTLGRALFNRAQVALAVLSASAIFHALADVPSRWAAAVPAAFLATAGDYVINTGLVTAYVSILHRTPASEVFKRLRIGEPREFLVSYLGLGALGLYLAYIHSEVGFWSVAAFFIPVIFARQMFFKSRALEEAHEELKEREQVLRALSNRMAEERQDERSQIAAYLHDDLAQLLFRLALQIDVAKRHLQTDDLEGLSNDLELLRETKDRTSDKVRALIRDLHRSPLGRAGLAEALRSFVDDVGEGSGVRFQTNIADLRLAPPIQLLIYQIAREAIMNALKHARASTVSVSLRPDEGGLELLIQDDGVGFHPDGPRPEEHFGLTMMRERAQVAGGIFRIDSAPGEGTAVTVRFPTTWLEEREEPQGPESPRGEPQPAEVELPAARSIPA